MNSPTKPSFLRRLFRWTLIATGLCLLPILALAAVAASCLTLDRDIAVLRKHVVAATGAKWTPKVQLSIGRGIIGSVATGMKFVDKPEAIDASLALDSVQHASVGVYERTSNGDEWSRAELFKKTDEAMSARGWSRMVGVADGKDTVLIYAPTKAMDGDKIDICLAVVSDKDLVVMSTSVNAATLAQLADRHAGKSWKNKICIAGLKI